MAWTPWLDTLVIMEGVTHGAILGVDGSTWAISDGLSIAPEEVKKLHKVLSTGEVTPAFDLSGQKYVSIRLLDAVLDAFGKTKGYAASIALTKSALVFAIHLPTSETDGAENVSQKLSVAALYLQSQLVGLGF